MTNNMKNEISLHDLCKIINEETLTQREVAKKIKRSVRTVKKQTADGKLNPLRFKSDTLYPKREI